MRRNRVVQVVVVASALLAASRGTSEAFHTQYDSLELKCRSTISKNLTKAITLGQKAIATCHKDRDKTGAVVDCNVLDASNADTKGKFAKAQAKLIDGVQKACIDTAINDDVLHEYVSCPEPCGTDLALPNPLTTYGQLSQCLACVARDEAEANGLAVMGLPAAPLGSAEQACRASIGKSYGKYLKTMLKDRSKCQNSAEKDGALRLEDTGCATADPKGKIALMLTTRRSRRRHAPARAADLGDNRFVREHQLGRPQERASRPSTTPRVTRA